MTDSEVWIMDRETEEKYIGFMQTQLSEMAETVRKNLGLMQRREKITYF